MEIYQTNVNKANRATFQLLEKALDKLGNLIENVDEVDQEPNETIILSIDESKFQVKRSIFCRICNVCYTVFDKKYKNIFALCNVLLHEYCRWILVQHALSIFYIRLTQSIIES